MKESIESLFRYFTLHTKATSLTCCRAPCPFNSSSNLQRMVCSGTGFMDRAHLSGGCMLGDKAHKGEHGETAVFELLQLVLLQSLHVNTVFRLSF